MGSWFGDKFNEGISGIKAAFGSIGEWFENNVWGPIKNVFNDVYSWFSNIGGNIISGIIDGIEGGLGSLLSAAKNVANNVLGSMKSVLGIASPSKVAKREIGVWIPEGVAEGIEERANSVKRAVQELVIEPISNVKYNLSGAIQGINQSAKSGQINTTNNSKVVNFYQTNNSPKALSRLEIYRMTKNGLSYVTR